MKSFSKIVLSVAAASAVAAVMAVSASAMSVSYDSGRITLTDVTSTGESQTLLVLDQVDLTTITETNIKQIDQQDDGTSFSSVPVGNLADGTYEVRIGGDGKIQTATFTVGGTSVETESLLIGDTNYDGTIDADDVREAARKSVDYDTGIGNAGVTRQRTDNTSLMVGDTNYDDMIDADDVREIARKSVDYDTGIGHAGESVEVIK